MAGDTGGTPKVVTPPRREVEPGPPAGARKLTEEADQKAAEQIAAGRKKNKGVATQFEDDLKKKAAREEDEATGKDIPFDVHSFITEGVVTRQNIQLNATTFIDLKTLTHKERLIAELLVKDKYGNLSIGHIYANAIEAAMLALAVLRINDTEFPMPDADAAADDPSYAIALQEKKKIFNMLLDSPAKLVEALSVVYNNLENIEVREPKTIKK